MTGFMVWAYISANVDVTRDVVYAKAGTVELKADVYAPANPTSAKQPWVVVIHGGSWMMGQRQDMAQFAEALALQGVVGITISYRLAPANKWPAMLEDSQGAVRYFKQNAGKYGLDPERVGAAGASAGGHLAMFLGFRDDIAPMTDGPNSRVKAVVNLFGPTDLSVDYPPALGQLFAPQVLGKRYEDAKDTIKDFSPINFITKDDAPVFTIQGDKDTTVPPEQARRLDRAMQAIGLEHKLVMVPGLGHTNPATRPEGEVALKDATAWIIEKLK